LARAALHDLLFVSQTLFGANDLAVQLLQIGTTDIAQFDPLEIVPDALVGVEIGSIC